jgi:hypothetical protein
VTAMLRVRHAAAGLTLALAGLIAVPIGAANADNGNNLPGCDVGEICFWYNETPVYEKDFYYTANHSGNNFMITGDGGSYTISSYPLQDDARDVANKDTQCNVRVGDLTKGLWTWVYFSNDSVEHNLGSIANRNDRHERCV